MPTNSTSSPLTGTAVAGLVARCAELVTERYVFADVADEIATRLRERLAAGAYAEPADQQALAAALTADLQAANGDRHLRVKYHAEPIPDFEDETAAEAYYADWSRRSMHGVSRVQRLAGNVGLLELGPALFPPALAGPSINAAMQLLTDTEALLLDARRLIGGSPPTVALLASYFFAEPTHLNTMLDRGESSANQSWTLPWVPGPRYAPAKPVWLLIGPDTFSGGEELAYDLQQLGRATVVGATSGGGANARVGITLLPHLELSLPVVQPRNPVTGANWEGVGVTPDVAVDGDAFAAAYRLALTHVAANGDGAVATEAAAELT